MTGDLLPGEFVIWTTHPGCGCGQDHLHFVRYLGVFDGQAVIEDARGSRGFAPFVDIVSATTPIVEPPVPLPPEPWSAT